jgi:AraC-like DNA-binding protein
MFIDEHYSENIMLSNIANEAFYSKYHFIRQFKKIFGKTPHKYLSNLRLEKSAQLLRAGSSVTETCFRVGFESLGSFSGLFKRSFGLSPYEYQSRFISLRCALLRKPLHFIPGCFGLKR